MPNAARTSGLCWAVLLALPAAPLPLANVQPEVVGRSEGVGQRPRVTRPREAGSSISSCIRSRLALLAKGSTRVFPSNDTEFTLQSRRSAPRLYLRPLWRPSDFTAASPLGTHLAQFCVGSGRRSGTGGLPAPVLGLAHG